MSPEINEDDEKVLVCAAENQAHHADSELILADCGHSIWISPSGVGMLTRYPEMTTQCLPCSGGFAQMKALAAAGDAYIPPGAMENLVPKLGAEAAADIERWAHDMGMKDHPDD